MSKVLVFDNDETIGYFRPLFAIYELVNSIWISDNSYGTPKISWNAFMPIFTQFTCDMYMHKCNGLRPGILKILKLSLVLQKQNKIDKIIIFTLASNKTGVVNYLINSIEKCVGEPVFDNIIDRTHTFFYEQGADIFPKKMLSRIMILYDTNFENILMFDDNIQNIKERYCKVEVVPYIHMPSIYLYNSFVTFLVILLSKYIKNFNSKRFSTKCRQIYNREYNEMLDFQSNSLTNTTSLKICHNMIIDRINQFTQ
jgi:hypothetical protein